MITPPLDASGGIGRLVQYLLEEMPPDVEVSPIDSRGHSSSAIWSIVPLCRSTAKLWSLHRRDEVDVVHLNLSTGGSTIRKGWLLIVAKALRLPVVVHLHASSYPEFFESLPGPARRLISNVLRRADRFLVLGSAWRIFSSDTLGISPDKTAVLRCGIPDPSREHRAELTADELTAAGPAADDPARLAGPAAKHHAPSRGGATAKTGEREPDGPIKILFLGRLGDRKGVPELLRALKVLDARGVDWVATLAGDGEVERFEGVAESLRISERVRFPGWVARDSVQRFLDECDVVVLPSSAEGLPVSVLEAFAHARPVIATPVGALPDLIENGRNSLFCDPGDVASLADAMMMLAQDRALARELGRRARETWREHLDVAHLAPELVAVWRSAAGLPDDPARRPDGAAEGVGDG